MGRAQVKSLLQNSFPANAKALFQRTAEHRVRDETKRLHKNLLWDKGEGHTLHFLHFTFLASVFEIGSNSLDAIVRQ